MTIKSSKVGVMFDGKSKRCSKCKKVKLLSEFHKRKKDYTGTCGWCKECMNNRPYDKQGNHRRQLKYKYSLTMDDYDKLSAQQNNVCAICNKPETVKNQWGIIRLAVDHNHTTGEVRGLLCNACNRALGFLDVDHCGVPIVEKVIDYLSH